MIDPMNKFGVAGIAGQLCLMFPIRAGQRIPADDALNLAAWLVTLAEHDATHTFDEVIAAVRAT